MFTPNYTVDIPMAHCGICNSSYPAQHYHQCCGQRPLPIQAMPVIPALHALAEICDRLGALNQADRNWLINRLQSMRDAQPAAKCHPMCDQKDNFHDLRCPNAQPAATGEGD
jgi:hypothetical protein